MTLAMTQFDELCQHVRETTLLESTQAVLEWDERTKMPPRACEYRAEQITNLSGMIHRRRTDPRLGEWLHELCDGPLAADLHSDAGTTIRQIRRDYQRRVKLPQSLVEEITRASVLGHQAWIEARKHDDFKSFQPHLAKMMELKRQQAAAIGYTTCAYDALLDEYEPGETTANVARVLAGLREALVPLVSAIAGSGRGPNIEVLQRHYPVDLQEKFGKQAAAAIGFDFDRGRLDETHHPFCSSTGPHDCRITTRYYEHFFPSALFSILHEAGHGLYDQGLRAEQFGLPPGSFVSLGIHESQSRMWENLVGRGRAFWQYFFPAARELFPHALGDVTLDEFYFAVNDVRPSLIRVEADEATYNLHIVIRFEMEQALIDGDLPVSDLPGVWKEKYRHYLGIEPPNDADGVLQDVHWSAGLVGYFPTYSLGNLYAAQFLQQADKDLGGLDEQFARGEFRPLLDWLITNIHRHGQCYSAAELVQRITGQPLHHQPHIAYLRGKLEPLYGL
jgi:carboxypeptidase Taq